ncbi:MAG: hypothetical protein GXP55_16625 [Deltaproteobacteria bacterium]|nr:hypothetical protein [Deltaproteobacteria bacterium]
MTRISLTLILAFGLTACGDASGTAGTADAGTNPPTGADGGEDRNGDASSRADAGTAPMPGFTGFAGFPADPSYSDEFRSGEASGGYPTDPDTRLSCFDGVDNDDSLVADCADPACQSLGSCCVGRGDCCEALSAGPLPTGLDVSGCAGTDAAACVSGLGTTFSTFGDLLPFLDRGALAPGGDASGDAGLVLGEAIDLRTHRVVLSADILSAEDCTATCLESVAIGFAPDAPMGRVVRPLVALLSSPSLNQMRLVIGDEVVKSFPVVAPSVRWSLTLDPEGRVEVSNDQPEFTAYEAPFAPAAAARLVIYGRSRNPSATGLGGARIGKLTINTSLCDMPSAWNAREQLPLLDSGSPAGDLGLNLEAPALVRDADVTYAAFARDGAILLGELRADGVELNSTGRPEYIRPDATHGWQAGGFDDPALLRPGARTPEVYFTATGADGTERIGMASPNAADQFEVGAAPLLEPRDYGLTGVSQPTVAEHSSGTTILLVHARDAQGTHIEAFYRESPAAAFVRITQGNLRALTLSGSARADADDVGEPSLVLFDHAWHLYVARRQGARYSVGLLASDELVSWRWVDTDAFGASGVTGAFDRLGARSPAALVTDNSVELLYLGLDGAKATLGRTRRSANGGSVAP